MKRFFIPHSSFFIFNVGAGRVPARKPITLPHTTPMNQTLPQTNLNHTNRNPRSG